MIRHIFSTLILLALCHNTLADSHEQPVNVRAQATIIEAKVLSINYETREASLELPFGNVVSLVVDPAVKRLDEIKQGDLIVLTYFASIAGELREPTEEEKAAPFVMLTDEVIADSDSLPGRAGGILVRAVCTIEGMNRITGRVMIKDSRGLLHVIEDVPAERFEGVTLGSTVIITYTQALAIALEKRAVGSE